MEAGVQIKTDYLYTDLICFAQDFIALHHIQYATE
jgi:hypothetical protein